MATLTTQTRLGCLKPLTKLIRQLKQRQGRILLRTKTPSSISKSPSVHSVSSTHSSTTGVEELLLTDFMTRYSVLCGSYCSVVASPLIQNEVFASSCTYCSPVQLDCVMYVWPLAWRLYITGVRLCCKDIPVVPLFDCCLLLLYVKVTLIKRTHSFVACFKTLMS